MTIKPHQTSSDISATIKDGLAGMFEHALVEIAQGIKDLENAKKTLEEAQKALISGKGSRQPLRQTEPRAVEKDWHGKGLSKRDAKEFYSRRRSKVIEMFMEGKKYAEISETLNVPLKVVANDIKVARRAEPAAIPMRHRRRSRQEV